MSRLSSYSSSTSHGKQPECLVGNNARQSSLKGWVRTDGRDEYFLHHSPLQNMFLIKGGTHCAMLRKLWSKWIFIFMDESHQNSLFILIACIRCSHSMSVDSGI